jgi:conjugative transposon TraK protein
MFATMKSMDTAFKQMRSFMICFLVCCTLLSGFVIYTSHVQVNTLKGKIYVMVNGTLVEAFARDRNLPVELRDHIERFHYLFFTLSPDEKVIQQHVSKALYLIDGSGKGAYQNLKESGYYSDLIAGNISQTIETDSIAVDMTRAPYYFKYFGRQIITRTTSTVIRNLFTEGFVRINLDQSDHNVHGFLIERWNTVLNTDIKTMAR